MAAPLQVAGVVGLCLSLYAGKVHLGQAPSFVAQQHQHQQASLVYRVSTMTTTTFEPAVQSAQICK